MYKHQGFSLLEAIVALVLIATTGMALFSWINTNLLSLQKVQNAQIRNEAVRNALAFIETINPMETPTGKKVVGIYIFEWQSEKTQFLADNASSLFKMGLFDINVSIYIDDKLIDSFSVRNVGYEQVRLPGFR